MWEKKKYEKLKKSKTRQLVAKQDSDLKKTVLFDPLSYLAPPPYTKSYKKR